MKFKFKDGKFTLLSSWVSGVYSEFAEGEVVFEFKYDDEERETKDSIYTLKTGQEIERYYSADYTSEIIIYSNDVARYCPSVNSSVNFCGEYELTDGFFSIKEAESEHIFKVRDDKLILTEYVDYQGISHKYEEEIFTKVSEHKTNEPRPGVYYCDNGRKVFMDNEGNICFHLNLDKEVDVESDRVYDKIQGKYVIEGDKLIITDENNNMAEFNISEEKIVLKKYKLYDVEEASESGIETYIYLYDDSGMEK